MSKEGVASMTEEQIRIMVETVGDTEAALDKVDPELAEQIRGDQEAVANITRIAQASRFALLANIKEN